MKGLDGIQRRWIKGGELLIRNVERLYQVVLAAVFRGSCSQNFIGVVEKACAMIDVMAENAEVQAEIVKAMNAAQSMQMAENVDVQSEIVNAMNAALSMR